MHKPILGLFILVGCAGSDPDVARDVDTDSDTDSGTDSDSDTEPLTTRFIALGDGGLGNQAQYDVSDAVQSVCAAHGCDFALYLGDNFYNSGVESLDDEQFQTKFELPYASLEFPFYAVLGNHDNGGTGRDFWRGDIQVDYAASGKSTKWKMPDRYYAYQPADSNVQLIGLDTQALLFDWDNDVRTQGEFVRDAASSTKATLVVAFGHHPFISNGGHGNAGEYEGNPNNPVANGENVKRFWDDYGCEHVDVYFCGHDHNLQWLEPTCGTEFIVSGAAAKTSRLVGRGNASFFEDDSSEGFMWVEVTGRLFTGRFYDRAGALQYEHSFAF